MHARLAANLLRRPAAWVRANAFDNQRPMPRWELALRDMLLFVFVTLVLVAAVIGWVTP